MAEKFVAGFAAALKEGRFEEFLKVLPPDSGKRFSKEDFDRLKLSVGNSFGVLRQWEYLGQLDNTFVHDYIWKMEFSGKIKNRAVLYRVRIGKAGGALKLAGFGFLL